MDKFICVDDYEEEAFKRLPKEALDYYRSGADEQTTLQDNRLAFKRWKLLPRFLRDVSNVDMSVEVFGEKIACPIGASPTAMHRLAHADAEIGSVKGVGAIKSILTLSTLSTTKIEDVAAAEPNLTKWLQLYLFIDRNESLKLIRRAEQVGFKALVLTVDAPKFGTRRNDIKNNYVIAGNYLANFDHGKQAKALQDLQCIDPSISWADVTWLTKVSKLPVLVKGLLTPEDCLLALQYGASGVVVSNHGGRQLDGVPATVDVLPKIATAINGRCPIFIDGGIRCGSDVFKCLALGARMVFVGRPVLWGLACGGGEGVKNVMEILRDELKLTMELAGCPSIQDVTQDLVVHETNLIPKL